MIFNNVGPYIIHKKFDLNIVYMFSISSNCKKTLLLGCSLVVALLIVERKVAGSIPTVDLICNFYIPFGSLHSVFKLKKLKVPNFYRIVVALQWLVLSFWRLKVISSTPFAA